MSLFLKNVRQFWDNYVRWKVDGDPSPASFWYLPEPARVVDASTLASYLASAAPSPYYLLDYHRKLEYVNDGPDGIMRLNYGRPIGRQVNPEAAFQIGLAHHDRFKEFGAAADEQKFLHYADYFVTRQDALGRWAYEFAWANAASPWYSALAQGRGMSLMVRAWLATGDARYRRSAIAAVLGFALSCEEGGFRKLHPRTSSTYFEEYPTQPSAVLNGFIASLFGLFEVAHWLGDASSKSLFAEGVDSLESILPYYEWNGWSLYDLDPHSPFANVNSPRYHDLTTEYLRILSTLTGRPALSAFAQRYVQMNTRLRRARALGQKLRKKLIYR